MQFELARVERMLDEDVRLAGKPISPRETVKLGIERLLPRRPERRFG